MRCYFGYRLVWPQRNRGVVEKGERCMAQTLPDPTRPLGSEGPQTYINHETPWWDASQVYGGGIDQKDRLPRRTGTDGKLIIGEDGRLAFPEDPKLSPDHVRALSSLRSSPRSTTPSGRRP